MLNPPKDDAGVAVPMGVAADGNAIVEVPGGLPNSATELLLFVLQKGYSKVANEAGAVPKTTKAHLTQTGVAIIFCNFLMQKFVYLVQGVDRKD